MTYRTYGGLLTKDLFSIEALARDTWWAERSARIEDGPDAPVDTAEVSARNVLATVRDEIRFRESTD